ncbi:MAG: hypothetical protein R3C58_13830 [Parvularculaceae bacterium]
MTPLRRSGVARPIFALRQRGNPGLTPMKRLAALIAALTALAAPAYAGVRDALPGDLRGAPLALEAPAPRAAQKTGALFAPETPQDEALAHLHLTNNWNKPTSAPLTVGVVFRDGALHPGEPVAVRINGEATPAQIDVKALHNDGSVRNAAVTFAPPPLAPRKAADAAIIRAAQAGGRRRHRRDHRTDL